MSISYFDFKRDLKKIYMLGNRAIKDKDIKYINLLVFSLNDLKSLLENNKDEFNTFGYYIINKEIEQMRGLFASKLNDKGRNNDKKSTRNPT